MYQITIIANGKEVLFLPTASEQTKKEILDSVKVDDYYLHHENETFVNWMKDNGDCQVRVRTL